MERLVNLNQALSSDLINAASNDELSLTDNRTGKTIKIQVK